MPADATGQMHRDVQGQWVWLDTMTRVRWLAALGQCAALLLAWGGLGLQFPLGLCLTVVAVSAASNLASRLVFPRSRRLSGLEVFLTLMFDTAQLSLLLFLTGGLHNPFALLLLAPVTIGATTLPARGTLALGLVTVALATVLALAYQPLRLPDGTLFLLPGLFLVGFWGAIVIGIAFMGLYSHSVTRERHDLAEALLATQMALAREQKLTDLGGVVAAAAHELGTPLATIKLASSELIDALHDHPDLADLAEDARLIREQADRCRTILRSMGQAGKQDLHLARAPLDALLAEAAAPHGARGRAISLVLRGPPGDRMPEVTRRPEIIHGLRNLIQNGVDFARSAVRVEADWTPSHISVLVVDDGPGYPPHLLARIGEPYLRDRRGPLAEGRRDYDGMGLGLFIAKTLLERTRAEVSFDNAAGQPGQPGGARARVRWVRADIETDARGPLGANQPFQPDTADVPAPLTAD
jgi:two-component system, sensor histidine kinase RegB